MKKLQTILSKIKLKEDKIEETLEWAKTLKERSSEVYETLVPEGIYLENVFIEKINEKEAYLYFYVKLENEEKNKEAIKNSKFAIDKFHQNYKKSAWAGFAKLEELLNFDRLEEFYNDKTNKK